MPGHPAFVIGALCTVLLFAACVPYQYLPGYAAPAGAPQYRMLALGPTALYGSSTSDVSAGSIDTIAAGARLGSRDGDRASGWIAVGGSITETTLANLHWQALSGLGLRPSGAPALFASGWLILHKTMANRIGSWVGIGATGAFSIADTLTGGGGLGASGGTRVRIWGPFWLYGSATGWWSEGAVAPVPLDGEAGAMMIWQ